MIKTTLFSKEGKAKGEVTLPDTIFAAPINAALMSQAVRVYLANQRRGTSKTKTRAEINRTKAKWFRQKGTGRARHGSRSAPIFVGGGIAHGPLPRSHSLNLSSKMRTKALISALSQKYLSREIIVMENYSPPSPKTKAITKILENLSLTSQKSTIVLTAQSDTFVKSARNLPDVTLRNATQLTTYDVLRAKKLLFQESSLATLINRLIPMTSSPVTPSRPTQRPANKKSTPSAPTRVKSTAKAKSNPSK